MADPVEPGGELQSPAGVRRVEAELLGLLVGDAIRELELGDAPPLSRERRQNDAEPHRPLLPIGELGELRPGRAAERAGADEPVGLVQPIRQQAGVDAVPEPARRQDHVPGGGRCGGADHEEILVAAGPVGVRHAEGQPTRVRQDLRAVPPSGRAARSRREARRRRRASPRSGRHRRVSAWRGSQPRAGARSGDREAARGRGRARGPGRQARAPLPHRDRRPGDAGFRSR